MGERIRFLARSMIEPQLLFSVATAKKERKGKKNGRAYRGDYIDRGVAGRLPMLRDILAQIMVLRSRQIRLHRCVRLCRFPDGAISACKSCKGHMWPLTSSNIGEGKRSDSIQS